MVTHRWESSLCWTNDGHGIITVKFRRIYCVECHKNSVWEKHQCKYKVNHRTVLTSTLSFSLQGPQFGIFMQVICRRYFTVPDHHKKNLCDGLFQN